MKDHGAQTPAKPSTDGASVSAPDAVRGFRNSLEGILGIPFVDGNRVDVLRNGIEIFPAMLDAIEQARSSINFLTYIYWKGGIADRFAEALAERSRSGVTVRVLLDSFGAKEMSHHLLDLMTEAGVHVLWFRPLQTWKLWNVDNRTHRKILVVDDTVGFTGGVGIAEEWEGDARDRSEWRDTHFRIEGPAVHGLQGAFFGDWAETGRSVAPAVNEVKMLAPRGEAGIQAVRSTASIGWSDIATVTELLIAVAKQRLRIVTPYFVPDPDTLERFCGAANRGVEVEIMIPGPHADKRVSELAGAVDFRPLLESGIRFWRYQPTMLHAKVIMVDDELACIESANFNQRSMRKDDEVVLNVLHRPTVGVLDSQFGEDRERCLPIELSAWKDRSLFRRLRETALQAIRPQV